MSTKVRTQTTATVAALYRVPEHGKAELINGKVVPAKGRYTLAPGDLVTFETPGGGGIGSVPA